jgi:hypothetical protein
MFLLGLPGFLYFVGIDLPNSSFRTWLKLVLVSAMVVVSFVEMKTGRGRDWLHWTGVMTYFATWSASMLR